MALGCAAAGLSSPAAASDHFRIGLWPKPVHSARMARQPFGPIPHGPLQIIISVNQQRLHLYSGGAHVADTAVATGVPGHRTPLGIFSIIQKSRHHRSNIYDDAPMPYMERITWSGVALHEGGNLGRPASHGCIRMSHDFATRLWALTKLGVRVIIARPELRPEAFADPHLFVHSDKPPVPPVPAPASPGAPDAVAADAVAPIAVNFVRTAQTGAGAGGAANTDAAAVLPAVAPAAGVSLPPVKPEAGARPAPLAIFVSGKNRKIYVRREFSPLFEAPITIADPERRLGTYVFTALDYLPDGSGFRWNVVAMPREPDRPLKPGRRDASARAARLSAGSQPAPSAREALARVQIPQPVIDRISRLIVPGSSLIISDQGLGQETGAGTGFIVVTR